MSGQANRVTEMLKALSKKGNSPGGLAPLLQMLSNMDRGNEKQIIAAIKQQHPQLAKQLEEQYFSFEDIVRMDDKLVKRALEEVHKTTLALALKGVDATVKMKVMNNLSARAAEILQDDIDVMGPQPKQLVEDAQREVTKTLRSWKDMII
jgi:flagellar motor switch protein FliG